MSINPALIDITTIPNLPTRAFAVGNYMAQSDASGIMSKNTEANFAAFIAPYVAAIGSAGYAPVSGLALPTPSGSNSFTIVGGPATYTHSGGNVVTTEELNILNWNGTVWGLAYGIDVDLSAYAKITDLKGFEKFLEPAGNNLFNKNDVLEDKAIDYTTGVIFDLSGFNVAKIKAKPNTYYKIEVPQQVAYFDVDDVYIAGQPNAGDYDLILTPPNTDYFLINVADEFLDTQNINEGINERTYESFKGMSLSAFIPSGNIVYKNILNVAKENAKYTSVNAAIADIYDDSADNQYSILIQPGIYEESVSLIGRYISLIGVNKETCVIKTFTNDYYHPPIDMACNNHLYNLTIIADDNGTTTPPGGVDGLKAYGIHFDIAGRFESLGVKVQGRSIIKNCRVISINTHAIALGLWTNQYLEFDDVEMFSPTTASFRAHNYLPTGATNQKMMVRACRIHNSGSIKPIVLQDANQSGGGGMENRDTVFSFQNTIAWNDNGQSDVVDLSYLGPLVSNGLSGYIKLGIESFGNNSSLLNFPNGT